MLVGRYPCLSSRAVRNPARASPPSPLPLAGLRLAGLILSSPPEIDWLTPFSSAPRNGPSDHSPELSPFKYPGFVVFFLRRRRCCFVKGIQITRCISDINSPFRRFAAGSTRTTPTRADADAPPIPTRLGIQPNRQTRLDQDVPRRLDILSKVVGK